MMTHVKRVVRIVKYNSQKFQISFKVKLQL